MAETAAKGEPTGQSEPTGQREPTPAGQIEPAGPSDHNANAPIEVDSRVSNMQPMQYDLDTGMTSVISNASHGP